MTDTYAQPTTTTPRNSSMNPIKKGIIYLTLGGILATSVACNLPIYASQNVQNLTSQVAYTETQQATQTPYIITATQGPTQTPIYQIITGTSDLEQIASTATPQGIEGIDSSEYGIIKLVKCDDNNEDGFCQAGEYIPGFVLTLNGHEFALPSSRNTQGVLKIGGDEVPYELNNGNLFLYLKPGDYVFGDPLPEGWASRHGNLIEQRTITSDELGQLDAPPVVFTNYQVRVTVTPSPTSTYAPTATPTNTPWSPTKTPQPTDSVGGGGGEGEIIDNDPEEGVDGNDGEGTIENNVGGGGN